MLNFKMAASRSNKPQNIFQGLQLISLWNRPSMQMLLANETVAVAVAVAVAVVFCL